jgi:hypothetical protein
MAFKIGGTQIYPGTLPTPSSADQGSPMYNDGTNYYFAYPGAISTVPGTGWRYRTIYTHGFLCNGYKGSNPWRSVNKTWHATDTTYYVGEQMDRAGAYVGGAYSDYNGYMFGTMDTFQGASSHVSSINLHNGLMRQNGPGTFSGTASNFGYTDAQGATADVGGWNLSGTIAVGSGMTNITGQVGYVLGGGRTAIDKLHFPTEIMYATSIVGPNTGQSVAPWGGQTYGWMQYPSAGRYITWSNDSISTWAAATSTDGQNKTLGSKYGWAYAGMGGNTDSRIMKFSDSTGAALATLSKLRGLGEENMEMGQDWGYMLGQYDGQQNNHTVKTLYSTDVQTQMGSACMPKGHVGQSSGDCFTAAATITSAVST